MSRASRRAALAVIMGTLAFHALGAQDVHDRLRKRMGLVMSSHPDAVPADPGSTITAPFPVENPSRDSLTVVPTLTPPADWSIVLGDSPFSLAPGESDTWLVSVRVPARTAPGRYAIQLRLADRGAHALLADSLVVVVSSRRGVDVMLADRPPYAVSGIPYAGSFLVYNRGNTPATYALRAVSSTGDSPEVPAQIQLRANESKLVRVAVSVQLPDLEARDDVLELRVVDIADTTVRADASSRVTVVQRAGSGGEEFHTVASTLRVRAADAAAGVSPYELMGGGQLRDGGTARIDFVARGKPAPGSPFGDREEYHVSIRDARFNTQLGDALYMASPLTSAGQRGFGGGLTLGDSSLAVGAYAQRFRFQLDGGSEQGAFLHLGSDELLGAPHLGVSGVNRHAGPFAGQLLGASGTLHPVGNMVVDVEYAASSAVASGHGAARSARLGAGDAVHVDLGHLDADSSYAGPSRGSRYDFASLNTIPWNDLQLRGSFASTRTTTTLLGARNSSSVRTGVAELTYLGRYAVGLTSFERATTSLSTTGETQRGLMARAEQPFGTARAWGMAEAGRANAMLDSVARAYGVFSGGASAQLGRSMLALFGEASRGATVLRGADRTLTLGFDAQLQIASATQLAISGSDTRTQVPDGGYTYLDARLTQGVSSGSISLRVRIGGRDIREAAAGQRLAYLEYSTPLQLPIGPSRAPGRVQGRVVDQQTGRGIVGAVVRLGPQAAITDNDGRVAFAGLPAGAYRVTLAQPLASGSSVFNGNPDVRVDSAFHAPATFNVAVEPAGRVAGTVRRLIVARTGIGSVPDSLADGGPMAGVSVALAGVHDTLYRTTDASGAYVFTDVPSGSWTVIVMAEMPEQTQWEQERIPIVLRAGEKPTVDFRLVPKRRRVKIVSGDGVDERGGGGR